MHDTAPVLPYRKFRMAFTCSALFVLAACSGGSGSPETPGATCSPAATLSIAGYSEASSVGAAEMDPTLIGTVSTSATILVIAPSNTYPISGSLVLSGSDGSTLTGATFDDEGVVPSGGGEPVVSAYYSTLSGTLHAGVTYTVKAVSLETEAYSANGTTLKSCAVSAQTVGTFQTSAS